jgi:putative ABC transport system permease protein
MFCGFAVIIYVLLLYLLAKMVVDKNRQNISMLKILGYTSAEAGRIYNLATAAVVVVALIVTTPLAERMMKILYHIFMKKINGWMPYYIPGWMFAAIPLIGMGCYLMIHLLLSVKIRRVKLAQALRSME